MFFLPLKRKEIFASIINNLLYIDVAEIEGREREEKRTIIFQPA